MFAIIKTSNAGALNRIITKYDSSTSRDGYFYFINSNTIFGGTLDNGVYYGLSNGVTNVTNGVWRSTGFSFSRNVSTKIYVDGQDDTQIVQVAGNNNVDVSNPLLIGQYGSSGYFNGSVDEIRIYNRALSTAEELALYNTTK